MLGRRRWPNIYPKLVQHLVLAVTSTTGLTANIENNIHPAMLCSNLTAFQLDGDIILFCVLKIKIYSDKLYRCQQYQPGPVFSYKLRYIVGF